MQRFIVAMSALLLASCSGTFEEARASISASTAPRDAVRCASLDASHAYWTGAAKGLAFAAGTSGLAVIPVNDQRGEVALSVAGVTIGAMAVASTYIADARGESWARECTY